MNSPARYGIHRDHENIHYIKQMLAELRRIAEEDELDMLCYLLEMAYLEASDIQMGRPSSVRERQ